jgi:Uri superfamily endonuclease
MRGSYVLILKLNKTKYIKIGKLGKIKFFAGKYAYVGKANGKYLTIEKRVERYKKLDREKKGKLRWHIDYFLVDKDVKIIKILKYKKKECELAKGYLKDKRAIKGFGCSDCNCYSHFFYLG